MHARLFWAALSLVPGLLSAVAAPLPQNARADAAVSTDGGRKRFDVGEAAKLVAAGAVGVLGTLGITQRHRHRQNMLIANLRGRITALETLLSMSAGSGRTNADAVRELRDVKSQVAQLERASDRRNMETTAQFSRMANAQRLVTRLDVLGNKQLDDAIRSKPSEAKCMHRNLISPGVDIVSRFSNLPLNTAHAVLIATSPLPYLSIAHLLSSSPREKQDERPCID